MSDTFKYSCLCRNRLLQLKLLRIPLMVLIFSLSIAGEKLCSQNEVAEDTIHKKDTHTTERHLMVIGGTYRTALRDRAFSPLIYSGSIPSLGFGLRIRNEERHRLFWMNLASGRLQNRRANGMTVFSGEIYTLELYRIYSLPEGIKVGWSGRNVLHMRDFDEAVNFRPRFDYHTNFGLAVNYSLDFPDLLPGLEFSIIAHWHFIGFFLQSGYILGSPTAYEEEDKNGLDALFRSFKFFEPFNQSDWGFWPEVTYKLDTGTTFSLSYRYDRKVLTNRHRSESSRGILLLTFMMPI